MRRKYENIAIILFVVNLVIIIIGFVLLQQNLTESFRYENLDKLHDSIEENAKNTIIIFILLIAFSVFMMYLLFKLSNDFKKKYVLKQELLTIDPFGNDGPNLENEQFQNIKALEAQKFLSLKNKITEIDDFEMNAKSFCDKVLGIIASEYEVFQGLFYIVRDKGSLVVCGSYAYNFRENQELELGEGLAGQVAKAKRTVNIKQIPSGYIKAVSGLGESTPTNLLICPLLSNNEATAVIELASFKEFSKEEEQYFTTLGELINEKLSNLK